MATTPPYEPALVMVDGDLAEMPDAEKPLPLPKFTPVQRAGGRSGRDSPTSRRRWSTRRTR